MPLFKRLIILYFLITASSISYAKNYENNADIEKFVQQQVNEYFQKTTQASNITIRTSPINARLRFTKCAQNYAIDFGRLSPRQARSSVKVSCGAPEFWSVHVRLQISALADVVVSKRAIMKGELLTPELIEIQQHPLNKIPRMAILELDNAVGYLAKRSLRANQMITATQLTPPYIIQVKDKVTILTKIGNLTISSKGIALSAAIKDGRIKVKNINSNKILEGIAMDSNTVLIP